MYIIKSDLILILIAISIAFWNPFLINSIPYFCDSKTYPYLHVYMLTSADMAKFLIISWTSLKVCTLSSYYSNLVLIMEMIYYVTAPD